MKARELILDEIKGVQSYVNINTLFNGIKDKLSDAATASDYLLASISDDNTEALILAHDIHDTLHDVSSYLSKYQAAVDIDTAKEVHIRKKLETENQALKSQVADLEEQVSLMNERFDQEVEAKTEELRQEFQNAETLADTFEQIASLLAGLSHIQATVNDIDGISEYVKKLQRNQQKTGETGEAARADKKHLVDMAQLIADYQSAGNKVTQALVNKYKVSKPTIINWLKQAGVYRGRNQ